MIEDHIRPVYMEIRGSLGETTMMKWGLGENQIMTDENVYSQTYHSYMPEYLTNKTVFDSGAYKYLTYVRRL